MSAVRVDFMGSTRLIRMKMKLVNESDRVKGQNDDRIDDIDTYNDNDNGNNNNDNNNDMIMI